ncbi:MAG: hypothetical protein HZA53_13150 [Planctomycetes bacterium]|nr:hypothetical protein [Planctomycetota bacterium]
MLRTKNLITFAAVVAVASLCITTPSHSSPFAATAVFSGGNNGGGNNGGNNGGNHDGNHGGNHGGNHDGNHDGNHGGNHDGNHDGNHGGNGGCNGGGGGPVCNAGGPYVVECGSGPLVVNLNATGSTGATTFLWSTNYAGAVIADPNAAQTTLTFTSSSNCCNAQFYVALTVGDGTRTRSCSTVVRVTDTTPPVIECPELAKVICGMDESPASTGTPVVTDNCDTHVQVTYWDRIVLQSCAAERLDHSVERTWRARDNCGNVATCVQTIHSVKVLVPIDVLPGTCPNVVTLNDCAPVRIAVLGSATFNVANVRAGTLKLYGEHCAGGPVIPYCAYANDVGTPFNGDVTNCECTDANGDGFLDLVFLFRRSQVVSGLGLANLPSGTSKRVVLVGRLCDGCSFVGTDCVKVP